MIARKTKLSFPDTIPDSLVSIATDAMQWEPESRPDFEAICSRLKTV